MWNPTRRNRNIGKTQGGRVKNGRAEEKCSRLFTTSVWRFLSDAERKDGYVILTENPSSDFYRPCNQEEVKAVLDRLPREITKYLRAVVLRRATRLDARDGIQARRRFSCILLNAFPKTNKLDWGTKPPSEADRSHYAVWCNEWILENGRWYQLWNVELAKRYYLSHLLLHELGHINQPSYHSLKRRESFAEDFALSWARKLKII
jgi:hypothetical protein